MDINTEKDTQASDTLGMALADELKRTATVRQQEFVVTRKPGLPKTKADAEIWLLKRLVDGGMAADDLGAVALEPLVVNVTGKAKVPLPDAWLLKWPVDKCHNFFNAMQDGPRHGDWMENVQVYDEYYITTSAMYGDNASVAYKVTKDVKMPELVDGLMT